jgi:hypothetical protein
MSSTRKTAVVAGVFFIVTEIAAIAGKVSLAVRGSRPGPRGARDCVGAAAPPTSRTVASNGATTMARPRIHAPLPGAALAAVYASVSDFTGATHGSYSHTSAPGSPAPAVPASRAVRQA